MFEKEPTKDEYIVTASDVYNAHELYHSKFGYVDSIGEFYDSLERIVRCRECKFLIDYGEGCIPRAECDCPQWQGYAGLRSEIEDLDNFCSWGDLDERIRGE